MANKKGKGKGVSAGKQESRPKQKATSKKPQQEVQATPQERVAAIRPLWESLSQEERVKLLTLDLQALRDKARALHEASKQQAADGPGVDQLDLVALGLEPTLEDILDEGVRRLKEKSTWKLWQWPSDQSEFLDAESFRTHVVEKYVPEDLRRLLPRDDPKSLERPAEAVFRQRMAELLAKVQQNNRTQPQEEIVGKVYRRGHRVPADQVGHTIRDTNVELINIMLEALEKEHECLYQTLLTPIILYITEVLPEETRETSKGELAFEDFEKLTPDDAAHIVEWLTEKIDSLGARLKPEPKDGDEVEEEEEEEENMGDVDLWALTDEGRSLTVNPNWLGHLQGRLLGEDGQPRKVKTGEDPHKCGLVLEWVYGSIVSTAEKARDGAKRCLGSQQPSAVDSHIILLKALEDQYTWETRGRQAKDLLQEMLKSRLEAQEIAKRHNIKPLPSKTAAQKADETVPVSPPPEEQNIPDEAILSMLRREVLLTKAKLHHLVFEHLVQERSLRSYKAQLKQGEPEFDRLKRELEEVKHTHRGLDGTYRSTAEMERHRARLADAAIEEQLEVQTAFREQGSRLQNIYEKKQRAEYDMAKRETEVKQLQGWKGTVENLVEKFTELLVHKASSQELPIGDVEEGGAAAMEVDGDMDSSSGAGLTPQQYVQLTKLRNHFHKDVRKQLYCDNDDKTFFEYLRKEVKEVEKRLEEGRVALQHLEMHLLNVACDDPGAAVSTQLALPALQEHIHQRALRYAAELAEVAETEIMRMEREQAEREAVERERKARQRAEKKHKSRSEKEKALADKKAKEEEERKAKLESEVRRKQEEEEERRKRQERLEALRRAEEEYMEQRRQELLAKDGYWRQRMLMEAKAAEGQNEDVTQLQDVGSAPADGATSAAAPPAAAPGPSPATATSSSKDAEAAGLACADDDGFVVGMRKKRHPKRDQEAAPSKPPAQSSLQPPQAQVPAANKPQAQLQAPQVQAHVANVPGVAASAPQQQPNKPGAPAQQQQPAPKAQASTVSPAPAPAQQQPQKQGQPQQPSTAAKQPSQQPQSAAQPPAAPVNSEPATVNTQAKDAASASTSQPAAAGVEQPVASASALPTPVPVGVLAPVPAAGPGTAPAAAALPADAESGAAQPVAAPRPAPSTAAQPPAAASPAQVAPESSAADAAGASQAMQHPPQAQPAVAMQPVSVGVPTGVRPVHGQGAQPPVSGAHPNEAIYFGAVPVHVGGPGGSGVPGPPMQSGMPYPAPGMMPVPSPGMAMPPMMMVPPGAMVQQIPGQADLPQQPQQSAAPVPGKGMPAGMVMQMQPGISPDQPRPPMAMGMPMDSKGVPRGPMAYPMQGPPHMMPGQPHVMPPQVMMAGPMQQKMVMHPASHQQGAPMMPGPHPGMQQVPGMMPPQHMTAMQQGPRPGPPPANGPGSGPAQAGMSAQGPHPSGTGVVSAQPGPMHPQSPANRPMQGPASPGPMMMPMQYPHMGGPMAMQPGPVYLYPAGPGLMHPGGQMAPHMMPPHLMMPGGMHPGMVMPMAGHGQGMMPHGGPGHPPPPPKGKMGSGLSAGAKPFIPSMQRGGMPGAGGMAGGKQYPGSMKPSMGMDQAYGKQGNGRRVNTKDSKNGRSGRPGGPNMPPGSAEHPHPSADVGEVQHDVPLEYQDPSEGSSNIEAEASQGDTQQGQQQQDDGAVASEATSGDAQAQVSRPGCAPPAAAPAAAAAAMLTQASTSEPSGAVVPAPVSKTGYVCTQPCHGSDSSSSPPVASIGSTVSQPSTSQDQQPGSGSDNAGSIQPVAAAVIDSVKQQQLSWSRVAASRSTPTAQPISTQFPALPSASSDPSSAGAPSPSAPAGESWKAKLQGSLGAHGAVNGSGQRATLITNGKGNQGMGSSSASPVDGQQHDGHGASSCRPVNRPTGPFLNERMGGRHEAVGALEVTTSGAAMYHPRSGASQHLRLVRGLRNGEGESNCFLNVIVQSLWHLASFRSALLRFPAERFSAKGALAPGSPMAADLSVLRALWGMFKAMHEGPAVSAVAQEQAGAPGLVSPNELREALSGLGKGQAAIQIQPSEMHDASEVLSELFCCLHRAELGQTCDGAADLQLPRRVRVRAELAAPASRTGIAGATSPNSGGYAAALGAASAAATASAKAAVPQPNSSCVQQLFGLDVQVPCPSQEGTGDAAEKASCNRRSSGQQHQGQSQQSPGSRSSVVPPGMTEVLQYTKFFHLVPAHSLRRLYVALPGASYEDLLLAAEANNSSSGNSSKSKGASGGGSAVAELEDTPRQPSTQLLRRPRVFVLAIVWESPQVPADAIRGTLEAVGVDVDLARVFAAAPGPSFNLRCVVCYFGHHYVVYVLSEELRLWLLFDDANIQAVGSWRDVCRSMHQKRLQPSLLFYEAASG